MILLLLACTDGGDSTVKPGDSDPATVGGVTVSPTAKETVWRVSWDSVAPGAGRVEYSTDGSFDHAATGTDDGLHHEVLLAGLGAGETWTCRAVTEGDGTSPETSETFDLDVPNPPSDLPGLTVSESNDDTIGGFLLVTNAYAGNSWVSLVDRDARRTWWDQGDEDDIISEAWMSADGQFVYWMGMAEGAGEVHKVSLDGEVNEEWTIPEAHHGFAAMPDGTLAVIRYDVRDYDGMSVYGDDLAIYDADGNVVRVVWSTFDSFEPDPELFPPDSSRFDWTHANSVHYEAAQNLFLVSLWDFSMIAAIDADSGELLWRLGGGGTFTLTAGEGFAKQHAPRLTDDGFMVFNNRDVEQSAEDRYSEVAAFTVDWDAQTYARSWSYDSDKELYVPVLGNPDALADGHLLFAWGSAGRAQEVDADHALLWQVDSDLGGPFGFVHLVEDVAGATR